MFLGNSFLPILLLFSTFTYFLHSQWWPLFTNFVNILYFTFFVGVFFFYLYLPILLAFSFFPYIYLFCWHFLFLPIFTYFVAFSFFLPIFTYFVFGRSGEAHQEIPPVLSLTQHHLRPSLQCLKRFLHHPRVYIWNVWSCKESQSSLMYQCNVSIKKKWFQKFSLCSLYNTKTLRFHENNFNKFKIPVYSYEIDRK